ncbi:amino acid adenylation domain-containing protein [Pseudoalteromonas sp. MMG005]|nr:amino acid adenylation domain-containing protein [Pseudoalteromonas sp. MMG005]
MLAVKIMSEVNVRFSQQLGIKQLFEHASIRRLATYITQTTPADGNMQIIPVERNIKAFALSYAQQRLWFIEQLVAQQSSQFNMPMAVRIRGDLDIAVLKQSLDAVLARHEVLRSVYRQDSAGKPQQIVLSESSVILPVVKITGSEQEKINMANIQVAKQAKQPFNLTQDSMLRAQLIQLESNDHVLSLVVHHIASDGWSLSILLQDLITYYDAISGSYTPNIAPLPVQYIDYANWQRNYLKGDKLENGLDFWLAHLDGAPPLHSIPLDQGREQGEFSGARVDGTLVLSQFEQLKKIAHQQSCTVFMLLQTAFAVTVGRFSNEQDVVMGMPAVNRNHKSCHNLIGLFLNTLVIRTQYDGSERFIELLQRMKRTHMDIHTHSDVPFELLVEHLNPDRSLTHAPVFQLFINMGNNESVPSSQSELRVSGFGEQHELDSKYDITLYLRESTSGLKYVFAYNAALFSDDTIKSLAQEFHALLLQVAAQPELTIAQFNWSQAAGVCRVIQKEAMPTNTIHALFEQGLTQHTRLPELITSEQRVSFEQLNKKANILAHYLINEKSVSKGQTIGIYCQRSALRIVAMLATLKAGATLVPMSTELPIARLQLQAEDANIVLLLHDGSLLSSCFSQSKFNLAEPSHTRRLNDSCSDNPNINITGDDIAHIIYTSGSTGKPKGVRGTHRSAVNRVHWMLTRFPMSVDEVSVMMTSMAFIRGMWEFYTALAAMRPVVLLRREQVKDANLFVNAIGQFNISRIVTTPSHLHSLVNASSKYKSVLSNLRYWFISGEALTLDLALESTQWLTNVDFYNLYGSTEVMSDVLYSNVRDDVANGRISLGTAITNNRVFLVDKQNQPVPVGAVGELLVVGENVAAGYLNRPEHSATVFTRYLGEQAYRTGDLGKHSVDGSMTYLGRKDNQVKIRGYRIEVNEISQALRQAPDVMDAIVLAKHDQQGHIQLVAYLNIGDHVLSTQRIDEIKLNLIDTLPEYMVPAYFVTVTKWPLSVNGKLQHSALPEPSYQSGASHAVPSNVIEEKLLVIWQELLNVVEISTTDNFFSLGGHSLLATRLVSQIDAVFGRTIALKAVFENNNIQQLARYIEAHVESLSHEYTQVSKGEVIPLSYAQQRLWFVEQVSPSNQYNMPLAFKVKGAFDLEVATQVLNYLVQRHNILQTRYKFDGQNAYQEVCRDFQIDIGISDLSCFEGDEKQASINRQLNDFYQAIFKLDERPPFNIHFINVAPHDGILLFNLHHIAADAWSLGILMREFVQCYDSFKIGGTPELPALTIQYSDFAYHQRQRLNDNYLSEQLAFWRSQLQDVPSIHSLPLDRARPENRKQLGAVFTSKLPSELVLKLQNVAQQHEVSMYMLLHASLALLVSKLSNQQDIVIGCPIANRTDVKTESLIGLFVNTLILRTQVQHRCFDDFLSHVREVNLNAHAHQDVPFEQLVDQCKVLRTASHTPLVQIVLNMNNLGQEVKQIEGIAFSPLEDTEVVAKTDLNLGVMFAPGHISINWTYDVALFDESTINKFSIYFSRILDQVVKKPDVKLSDISLLDYAEREALMARSCGKLSKPQQFSQIHHMLEYQAEQSPQAIALVCDEARYSYQALNHAVNQLSHYLLNLGLPTQSAVGVCMERSSDMVIAMYAIAKAGLIFTPLDPEQPAGRRAFIINNTKLKLVLSHEQFESVLSQEGIEAISYLDAQETHQAVTQYEITNPILNEQITNLAYIMYTSGSSGEPKGVQIEHQQIIASTQSRLEAYREPAGRFLSLSSIYFDSCLLGIFGVIAQGGELHIVKDSDVVDISTIYGYLMEHDITHLAILPTMYRSLLQYANLFASAPSCLGTVITGGEGVERDLQQLHFNSDWSKAARFYNEYGPTEATVWSSYYEIDADDQYRVAPIGRAAGHVNLYVLDQSGHLVPQGCEGELYIGGQGLARGYVNNASLTTASFIESSLFTGHQERLYKTGDIVRYNNRGNLEFIGRKDNQVKIRGYRVELNEIEQQIQHHPDVLDCVAKVWEAPEGSKILIAYVCVRDGQTVSTLISQIKSQLLRTLPAYMQPNAITDIAHIPVNRNGKVDRQALPKPNLATLVGEYIAPDNNTQIEVARIWAELLHLNAEEISVTAEFFELGGHSLLAVQVVTKINETFHIDLSIKAIFNAPVLRDLAHQIDEQLKFDDDELASAEAELADMTDEEIEKLYQELCDE